MDSINNELRKIPAIDKLTNHKKLQSLISEFNSNIVTYYAKQIIDNERIDILNGKLCNSEEYIINKIVKIVNKNASKSLKKVINATGIVIHTNLGRAPYSQNLINEFSKTLNGYSNLEFNLEKGQRGQRNDHATELLKYLTGTEDVVIVNNNAAAVMLILRTFARKHEVIVSRGELIEIGGAFRIPDIMAASDCKMIEVGTTNKTKAQDYKDAITNKTKLLLKTHKSNYVIKGFTKEVSLTELVKIGKENNIPVVFDIGSGLLRKVDNKALKNEPDVKEALASGIDIICFSGDKLLGGPQAGIIAGKKQFIAKLKKEPMMRALRPGKETISLLETACTYYLNDEDLFTKNQLFKTLNQTETDIKETATKLHNELTTKNIQSEIVKSKGQYGGGTLPEYEINSYSVKIICTETNKKRSTFAEKLYQELLNNPLPILSVLKQGDIYFDALTLIDEDISKIAEIISTSTTQVRQLNN